MEASVAASITRAVSNILVIIIIITITLHCSSQVIHRLALSLPKSQILVIIKFKNKQNIYHDDNGDNNVTIVIIVDN